MRVVAVLATPDGPLPGDPGDYARHARTIASTGHYPATVLAAAGPTAIRPPAYPYLLGGIYAVTGNSVRAGRLAQALLGAGAVALLALVSLELFGAAAAVAGAALAAVFPPLVMNGMTLLSEPLFVVLVLASVLAVLRWRASLGLRWLAAAGVLTGLALLSRTNALFVLLPLLFAARGRGWRGPALLLGCAVLIVAPWTLRNALRFHSFVPVSDQDGVTLAGSYNATSRGHDAIWIPANLDPAMRRLYERYRSLDEVDLSERFRTAARHFAADHPGYVPAVGLHNVPRLFNLGGAGFERIDAATTYGLGGAWPKLMTWSMVPLLLLAVAGAFTRGARAGPLWLWAIPVLLLSTIFVVAANRHRAAIDPFLLMLGGLAVAALWGRTRWAR